MTGQISILHPFVSVQPPVDAVIRSHACHEDKDVIRIIVLPDDKVIVVLRPGLNLDI
jgi:hypothetical protein